MFWLACRPDVSERDINGHSAVDLGLHTEGGDSVATDCTPENCRSPMTPDCGLGEGLGA